MRDANWRRVSVSGFRLEGHASRPLSFQSLGLALFSGVFEVGGFVIGSHNNYLPAFLLKVSNITIAEFRAPFES